jgi:hypothetical protein
METTRLLVCRGFLLGALVGTVGVMVWGLWFLWLDHTEIGQDVCYTQAVELYPERFDRADAKVSLAEGARMGRPSAAGLGFKLIFAIQLAVLVFLPEALRGKRRRARHWIDLRKALGWYFVLLGSSVGGAVAVILVFVLLF